MKKFIWLYTIIFSTCSYAATGMSYIHQYKFLSDGFNMQNYQSCKALIAKSCPAKTAMPDCGNILDKKPVCSQLSRLSQALGAQISTVSLKQQGKVILVSQTFPADGQDEYYLISSSHELIDTNIDPLKLDTTLKQKYQKVSLFPVHWGVPKIQLLDNKQIFNFSMKAHDTCLACKIVLTYNLQFMFNESGKFISVDLSNRQTAF